LTFDMNWIIFSYGIKDKMSQPLLEISANLTDFTSNPQLMYVAY